MLSKRQALILVDLINVAWQAGALRSPAQAQEVEQIRAILLKEENDNAGDAKDGSPKQD